MENKRCEVLIVGGGILGLWVLDRLLERGCASALLLESDLHACGQTGHSDAFLHQGYAYYSMSGARVLIDAWNAWHSRLPFPTPPLSPQVPEAFHVYLDPLRHQAAVQWRRGFQPLPPASHNLNAKCQYVGPAHDAVQTDERCVPGDWIAGQLACGKDHHIRRIQRVGDIALEYDHAARRLKTKSIEVIMGDGTSDVFEPDFLALCAGGGNRELLQNVTVPKGISKPTEFAQLNQLQREVGMDMLVVRDREGVLPAFNGSLYGGTEKDDDGNVWNVRSFVVCRRDLNGHLVWIISGQVYRVDDGRRRLSYMTGTLLRKLLIQYLSSLFVAFRQHHAQMVWGFYPARLTTWRRPAGAKLNDLGTQTFTDMGVDGLLVCFTDRLTITPLAADEIQQEITSRSPPGAIPLPDLSSQPVAVHPEYWRTPGRWEQQTSWSWAEFQANCL